MTNSSDRTRHLKSGVFNGNSVLYWMVRDKRANDNWALLEAQKIALKNNAPLIVCDPRFTRTAAHADEYVRFRPGSDVALIWGIMWHIFENKWEDKEFIRQRVYGMDDVRAEVKKWNPKETERVTGVPGSQLKRVAKIMANNRPGTFIWCMGGTQHTNGNNNTRA